MDDKEIITESIKVADILNFIKYYKQRGLYGY